MSDSKTYPVSGTATFPLPSADVTVSAPTLPSLDLTKYEGHTPGPWVLDAKNGCVIALGVNGVQVAMTFFIGSSNAQKRLEAINARLIADAPQLLAALLTMQRERDEALGVAKGTADILAAAVFENANLRQQLAASERTVNNWREAMRQLGEVNEYELDQIEQRATEIGNKKD